MLNEQRKNQVVDLCRSLIRQPSYSGQEGSAAAVLRTFMESNGFDTVTTDRYGNLATCYAADSITGEKDFFYYVTIKETAESFWLVQFVCPGETAEEHVDNMAQWSSTFTYSKPAEE